MIVPNPEVKGGIASVVNGYRTSDLEKDYHIIYVESYIDGSKMRKFLKGCSGYLRFIKVLLIDRPDIVHIHSSFGPSFYRKIPFIYMAKWVHKPIINHCHGAEFDHFYINASERKKRLIKKVYNKCDAFIALSEEWKDNLLQIVPKEKITVIENYSIINEEAVRSRELKENRKQILFLGELGQRKGVYDIPKVVKEVAQVFPDVIFILGGDGEMQKIKGLVKKNSVEKNVIFPGWVRGKEKDKLLKESDVFFLPSYNEGMPMSILDAMGYGMPIISTNVGGIPKIVKNGENGYRYDPGDIHGFAHGIIELLKDSKLRSAYGKGSYMIIKQKYSLSVHIHMLEELYKGVIGE